MIMEKISSLNFKHLSFYTRYVKRLIDMTLSFVGLLFLLLPLLVIAVLIRLDSKGPVFFLQERIGQYGKTFRIIKFRTMVVGAEHIGSGLQIYSFKDARITKVGLFLRTTSLDELPQLINILKGDMSLVGPRPPVTYAPYAGYAAYPDWAKKRFLVKPGLTGSAQIKYRNNVEWNQRIIEDIHYLEKLSFSTDLLLLFKTAAKFIEKEPNQNTAENSQKNQKERTEEVVK
ncbi:sugar transferase [Desemzia sp. RIT 804]|uniref:sugar transferase n=1 Tax=Desemzia sp. RIT 804 TaxID=2810209 RepID=UPI001F1721FF|nr:sugar transferase [Desemzia sp. RIT 804]